MKKALLLLFAVCFLSVTSAHCFEAGKVTEEKLSQTGTKSGEVLKLGDDPDKPHILDLGEPTEKETSQMDKEKLHKDLEENISPPIGSPPEGSTEAEIDF